MHYIFEQLRRVIDEPYQQNGRRAPDQGSARRVHHTHEHLDALLDALTPITAHPPGVELAHVRAFISSQLTYLEHHSERLRAFEERYVDEQYGDMSVRGELAMLGVDLDNSLREARNILREVDSETTLHIYGLVDIPPRARHALVDYAQNAIVLLRAHPHRFYSGRDEVLDTRQTADTLADQLAPFEELVTRLQHEILDLREALDARNTAVDHWINAYQGVCCVLEGLFHQAGLHDIADRLSPSFRRIASRTNLGPAAS
ncbi:MAG: hypothetical protein AAGI01_01090 [Myxococcota bacterium]